MYFLYTTGGSENVPPIISSVLESIQPSLSGCNLLQMLDQANSVHYFLQPCKSRCGATEAGKIVVTNRFLDPKVSSTRARGSLLGAVEFTVTDEQQTQVAR